MSLLEIVFILSVAIIFYAYFGYGLLVWSIIRMNGILKRDVSPAPENLEFCRVTLIIAAYNEQDFIAQKIENTLRLDYPDQLLDIICVTDGSTDRTVEILRQYQEIRVLHQPERNGKIAAVERAMSYVSTPVVIFSDANTLLNTNAVKNIVRHYSDENVGGVAGEKKVMSADGSGDAGEGLYWKYESWLKKLDSKLYTVVGAAGELFSIRTSLYSNPGRDTLLDDFMISMKICQSGYRVVYDPEAFATETPSASLKEEQKRKIRISAGAFQAMAKLLPLLNVFKYPVLSFQYISHRVLRWTLCPLLIPVALILNIILVAVDGNLFYSFALLVQSGFYICALLGYLLSKTGSDFKLFYPFYYFLFININLYQGFTRYLRNTQTVLWDKAARSGSIQ